ncbi:MAG TPA: hypothetical protein IGQ44_04720 [Geminocystis sp. M7585_C2015_104]|nr:hypothetical protein [Geminocystis sp. M7585_C2015_104]
MSVSAMSLQVHFSLPDLELQSRYQTSGKETLHHVRHHLFTRRQVFV